MQRFKNISFCQNRPKIKLFLWKNTNFLSARGSAYKPPKQPSIHCIFLATSLFDSERIHHEKPEREKNAPPCKIDLKRNLKIKKLLEEMVFIDRTA